MLSKRTFAVFIFSLWMFTLAGCAAPTAEPTSTPIPPAQTATSTPAPPTLTPTPSATPTETPIPVSVMGMPDMLVDIKLALPLDVASGATYDFVPYASTYKKSPRHQLILPQYGQFTLAGYPIPVDALEEPAIRIFTTAGMASRYQQQIDAVQDVLAFRPSILAKLPTFPNQEVAALQVRLKQPLDFVNGTGFRFINFELIKDEASPLPRASVSYIYQGLSRDGKFYLSVILPVDLPALRFKANEVLIKIMSSSTPQPIESYYPDFLDAITAAREDEFLPNLAALDELIRSIEIISTR